MRRWEVAAPPFVDYWNGEQFRELDQRRHSFGIAPKGIGDDQRSLRIDQHFARAPQRLQVRLHRRGSRVTINLANIEGSGERVFLNISVVIDVDGRRRLGGGDAISPDK